MKSVPMVLLVGEELKTYFSICMLLSHSVVDCGQPASVEDTVLLSVSGTTYSSVAMFGCDEGFVWRSGDNSSVCGADGLWTGLTMVCEGNKTQAKQKLSASLHSSFFSSSSIIHLFMIVHQHTWLPLFFCL